MTGTVYIQASVNELHKLCISQDFSNCDLHSTFPVVTVLLVSMDPVSGTVGLPDVSVPENGLDPRLCVQLTGGVTITRDVTVTLSTVGGTAQGIYNQCPLLECECKFQL